MNEGLYYGGVDGVRQRDETPIERFRREARERESLAADHLAGLDSITNADGLKVTKGVNMTTIRGNSWGNRSNPSGYGVSDELGDRDPVIRIVNGVPEMTDPTAKITESTGGSGGIADTGQDLLTPVKSKAPIVVKPPFYETDAFKVVAAIAVVFSIIKMATKG